MAWQYVGGTSGAGTSTGYTVSLNGTLTGGIASSPAAGDLVVVFSGFGNTASSAPNISGNNSGAYTGATAAQHVNDTWDTEFRSFYAVMGGTPDTSLTVTRTTNAAYGGATVVHVWRGVDTANPFIGAGTNASAANTSLINPPAYNPGVTDALIIAGGAGTQATTGAAFTGFTGMSNFRTQKGDGTTSDIDVAMASYAYAGVSYDPPVVSGGTGGNASSSWAGVTIAFRPFVAVTHATTGVLAGQGAVVTGSADRFSPVVSHDTSGGLVGSGSALAGASARLRAFATSGSLIGPGAALVGGADRQAAPSFVTHDTNGALAGPGAAVSGSAARVRVFSSSGVLAGAGATLAGASARFRQFSTAGALSGGGAVLDGAAQRFRAMGTAGTLVGQGASLLGGAYRFRSFDASGVLTGPGSSLAGVASRTHVFGSSGVLVGGGASLVGVALRISPPVAHATAGALTGPGAVLDGAGSRSSGASYTVDGDRAALIYQMALLHGLDPANPLVVDANGSRSAGGLQQSIDGTDPVTITTTAVAAFPGGLNTWIDALAAIHGLTVPLVNSTGLRTAGAITQSIDEAGGVITVTRV